MNNWKKGQPLPDYQLCSDLVDQVNGEYKGDEPIPGRPPTALEEFIEFNEPAGMDDAIKFRDGLTAALDWAVGEPAVYSEEQVVTLVEAIERLKFVRKIKGMWYDSINNDNIGEELTTRQLIERVLNAPSPLNDKKP